MNLPGRVPGYWRTDLKLLPTNSSKRKVYDAYCIAVDATTHRKVSLVTFRRIWREATPFIVTMRPATDLCWYCQQAQKKLAEGGRLNDQVKQDIHRKADEHLKQASAEREYYRNVCEQAKQTIPPNLTVGNHEPCSFDGMNHYSMDFAQQVHFPYNPRQPGPVFFKTPRKCAVFGVACEALPKQVTFLIDEAVQTGKGANCVISLLHYYFEHYGLGEKHMHLHADNCSGQNKNSFVVWYLMWRVLTGRHVSIKYSFLLAGHTKFSCDWCFGLFKRNFRNTKVDCLDDIAESVKDSSVAGVNVPQLCELEDGTVIVPTYNWVEFLSQYFTKVKDIKQYHHFHFNQDSHGVEVKKLHDTETSFQPLLVVDMIDPNAMPNIIEPRGLDYKRKKYLYQEIREFVAESKQDLVCPDPGPPPAPAQESSSSEESSSEESSNDSSDDSHSLPPRKRGRGRGGAHGRGRSGAHSRGRGKGRCNEQ